MNEAYPYRGRCLLSWLLSPVRGGFQFIEVKAFRQDRGCAGAAICQWQFYNDVCARGPVVGEIGGPEQGVARLGFGSGRGQWPSVRNHVHCANLAFNITSNHGISGLTVKPVEADSKTHCAANRAVCRPWQKILSTTFRLGEHLIDKMNSFMPILRKPTWIQQQRIKIPPNQMLAAHSPCCTALQIAGDYFGLQAQSND